MSHEKMRALVLHGIGDIRLDEIERPQLQAGEALVRVAAVGVCGSDLPRIYEHGAHSHPLVPGHEMSGIVAELNGPGPLQIGSRVTVKPLIPCLQCGYCQIGAYGQCTDYDYIGSRSDGACAEYARVPQANLVELPEGVDLIEAALTEPVAVALHALRQADVSPGDVVAVLGAGPIGMMVAQWAHVLGAGQVLLVDIDAGKLAVAQRLALGETCNARERDPVAWTLERTQDRGADVVVEAAGVNATVEQALRIARPLGRVTLLGNPAGDVTLPQATVSQILRKQLTIRGSWNSHFARLPVDEWRVSLDMMAEKRIDVGPLITHRVPLQQGIEALEMMRARSQAYGRVVLVNDMAEGGLAT